MANRANIDIDAARVRAAADDTESLSQQVMKRLSHSLDTSDEVYASHYGNGWESPTQLRVCALKREEHMVSLAKRMGELSQKVRDSEPTDRPSRPGLVLMSTHLPPHPMPTAAAPAPSWRRWSLLVPALVLT